MAKLSSAEQDRLLSAAREVVRLQEEDSLDPTTALAKVAEKFELRSGEIEVVGRSCNAGDAVERLQSSKEAVSRLAAFPVADVAAAKAMVGQSLDRKIASVRGGWDPDAAASRDWSAPYVQPTAGGVQAAPLVKAASVAEQERPTDAVALDPHSAYRDMRAAEQRKSRAEGVASRAGYLLERQVGKIAAWFGLRESEGLAYLDFREYVELHGSDVARKLAELAAPSFERYKTAFAFSGVSPTSPPFEMLREAVRLHSDWEAATIAALATDGDVAKTASVWQEASRPKIAARPAAEFDFDALDKEGSLSTWMTMQAGANGFNALRSHLKDEGRSEVEKQLSKLEDVSHQQKLQAIELETMLAMERANPDSPIGALPMGDVLDGWNAIVQQAPALASRPAAVRPMLAKQLHGQSEPFETDQLLAADERVRKSVGYNPVTLNQRGAAA